MKKPTADQIKKWKNKHGDIYHVKVEDKECYLHKPDRKTLAYAMSFAQTNPLKFSEVLVENCWIDGDEEIKNNDAYFLGLSGELDKLIEIKTAELVKL